MTRARTTSASDGRPNTLANADAVGANSSSVANAATPNVVTELRVNASPLQIDVCTGCRAMESPGYAAASLAFAVRSRAAIAARSRVGIDRAVNQVPRYVVKPNGPINSGT